MLEATTSTVRGAGGATGAGAGGAGGGCATASGCGAGGAGGGWECAQAATMNARATGTGTDRMVHSPLQGAIACACPLAVSKHNAGAGARRRSHCRAASFLMELSTGCQPLLQFQRMGAGYLLGLQTGDGGSAWESNPKPLNTRNQTTTTHANSSFRPSGQQVERGDLRDRHRRAGDALQEASRPQHDERRSEPHREHGFGCACSERQTFRYDSRTRGSTRSCAPVPLPTVLPSARMKARSATSSACATCCSTSTTVTPALRIAAMISKIPSTTMGASPSDGSS